MTIEEFDNEVGNLEDMKNFCKDHGYEDYWDDLNLIHTDDLDDEIEERVRDILRYGSWKEAYSFLSQIDDYSETSFHRDDDYFLPVAYEDETYIIEVFKDYLDEDGYFEEEPEEEAVEEEEESDEAEPEPLELIDTTTPENVEQFVLEENNEDNEDEFWDTEEEEEYLEEAVTEVLEKYSDNVMEELNKFLLGGY